MNDRFDYDVALSFAGPDRQHAEALATLLTRAGLRVFYDKFETSAVWGEDLYTYLADVYKNRARYCVIFISEHYAASLWTSHERKFAQARAFHENRAYILPVRIDDTELPGIPETVAYIDLRTVSLPHVGALLLQKLKVPTSEWPDHGVPRSWEVALASFADATSLRLSQSSGAAIYVPLRYEDHAGTTGLVAEKITEWLGDPTERLLFVLGDYGTGKTTLCQHLTMSFSQRIATAPTDGFIPVLAPVREVQQFFSSPEPISAILDYLNLPPVPESRARYLLFFDGYDEISDANDEPFHTLIRKLVDRPGMKIVVTARSHFFRSERAAKLIFARQSGDGTALEELESQLEWVTERILHLQPFDDSEVQTYLSEVYTEDSSAYFAKLVRIYDLHDLSRRPILLSLIASILPEVDEHEVFTQDALYEKTVGLWLDRESWRGLDTDDMLSFAESLATTMFFRRLSELNFKELSEEVKDAFHAKILSLMDLEYLDSLIRTSGFLYRDPDGNFSFMHRSFLEYFFARVLRRAIEAGRVVLLGGGEFTEPVYFNLLSSWKPDEQKAKAISLVNQKLGSRFDDAYALSDGIVELLASSMARGCPGHRVTVKVNEFVQKRESFRADERALQKHARRLRGQAKDDEDDARQSENPFRRVMMIGGGGRIYYTTEHYSFALFVERSNVAAGEWAFLLGYTKSWIHT